MAVKIQNSTVIYDDRVFNIKTGTTTERPTSPVDGTLWYNTELGLSERYTAASGWVSVGGSAAGLEDMVYAGKGQALGADWVEANGSVALQSTYPNLFNKVGILPTNDVLTWTVRTSDTVNTIESLTYGNGLFVRGGQSGRLATSTDGITWTVRTSGTLSTILSLTYGNGLFARGDYNGAISTSTDGITWTVRTSGTTTSIYALTYGNGLFVYGGGGGVIGTSTNGITWTVRTSGTTQPIFALTYGNSLFIRGGNQGALGTSTDGITWTARTQLGISSITSLTYGKGLYVATYEFTALYTSTDAITWTARTTGLTYSSDAVQYGANMFVAYGVTAGILGAYHTMASSSFDGITWVARTVLTSWDSSPSGGNLTYGEGVFVLNPSAGDIRTSSVLTYNEETEFLIPKYPPIVTGTTDDSNYFKPYLKN